MGRTFVGIAILAVVVLAFSGGVSGAASRQADCGGKSRTIVDKSELTEKHVVYTVSFNQSSKQVCVEAVNNGEIATRVGYGINVDNVSGPGDNWNLSPGESVRVSHNVTSYFDVLAENHTVAFGSYGGETSFHFTRDWNSTNEGGIPSPYISNVSVHRNRATGSVLVNVTAVNPSKQLYAPSLVLETFETDTDRGLPSKTDSGKLKYHFELDESPNETVAGQLRLYQHYKDPDSAFDQKEFVSKPEEEAQAWDVQFGGVPSIKEINGQNYYSNESAREFRDQGPDPISRPASIAGTALVVLLVVGGFWWRRRRKFR